MNIQSSTASTVPTAATNIGARPDTPTMGHAIPDAGDGVDVGAQGVTIATTPSGFGSILSKHLGEARAVSTGVAPGVASVPFGDVEGVATGSTTRTRGGLDLRAQRPDTGVDDATDGAVGAAPADSVTKAVEAASGVGVLVPQDLFPTLVASTAATSTTDAAAGVPRKTRAAADDRTSDADAGSDLAAQLALASQWTGAAMPLDPAPRAAGATVDGAAAAASSVGAARGDSGLAATIGKERATPVGDDAARAPADPSTQAADAPVATAVAAAAVTGPTQGSIDLESLFGKDRVPAGQDDAVQARGTATPADAATVVAATASSGDSASTGSRQRDERSPPVDSAQVNVTKNDDAKTRSDLALAVLDAATAGAATTRPDTIVTGDAFAQRLAIHASAPATGATAATTAAASAPAAFAFVQEPVGSNGWSHEVGQAALRMAASDLQSASIRLNPEHLGPLDVQVRVDNGIAHVAFNATHVDTRQALEASRGTLDQLFANQGLKMGDVSVGSGTTSGSSAGSGDAAAARGDASADASRRDRSDRWSGDDAGGDADAPVTTVTSRIARALGLVDTFA